TASPARLRTSTGTRVSGTRRARSARSRSGPASRAAGARPASSPSSRLLRVRQSEVDGLDRASINELAGQFGVEAGARHVELALAGRDLGAQRLEDFAVADGAVADARRSP